MIVGSEICWQGIAWLVFCSYTVYGIRSNYQVLVRNPSFHILSRVHMCSLIASFSSSLSVMHLSNLTKGHLLSEILSLCIHLSPWHSSTATKASSIKGTKHKARGSCHSCVKTTVRVSSQQQKISKLSLSVYLIFPVAEHC